jgi:hypothetical protein
MNADCYHLVFDRGEPFKGHVDDRLANKKARQQFPVFSKIASITEAASSAYPALQVTDLYAWCVSQKDKRRFDWQKHLLSLDRLDQFLPYDRLIHPKDLAVQFVKEWKLPPRRPNP